MSQRIIRAYLDRAIDVGNVDIPRTLTSDEYDMEIGNNMLLIKAKKELETYMIPLCHVLVLQDSNDFLGAKKVDESSISLTTSSSKNGNNASNKAKK